MQKGDAAPRVSRHRERGIRNELGYLLPAILRLTMSRMTSFVPP
jgi:hypothetical protein